MLNKPENLTFPTDASILILTGANGTGKTRLLEKISSDEVENIYRRTSKYNRILCLSGTVMDRFPVPDPDEKPNYAYFGRKTNNNMFSEILPFRSLTNFLIHKFIDAKLRSDVALESLRKIGIGSKIYINFRRVKKAKVIHPTIFEEPTNVTIDLKDLEGGYREFSEKLEFVKNGLMIFRNFSFFKNDKKYELSDLSSGERSYVLAILAITFSTVDNTLVIYDEPENSLHPRWQASIMNEMWTIIDKVSKKSLLLVATHSPLIVSSAPNESTYVFDLESSTEWVSSEMYGNNSDSILRDQFGMPSARSLSFLLLVQKCLDSLVNVNFEPEKFSRDADALLAEHPILDKDDPLQKVIVQIKTYRRSLK